MTRRMQLSRSGSRSAAATTAPPLAASTHPSGPSEVKDDPPAVSLSLSLPFLPIQLAAFLTFYLTYLFQPSSWLLFQPSSWLFFLPSGWLLSSHLAGCFLAIQLAAFWPSSWLRTTIVLQSVLLSLSHQSRFLSPIFSSSFSQSHSHLICLSVSYYLFLSQTYSVSYCVYCTMSLYIPVSVKRFYQREDDFCKDPSLLNEDIYIL